MGDIKKITPKRKPKFPCWLYCPSHPEAGGWTFWESLEANEELFTHWASGSKHEHPEKYPNGAEVPNYVRYSVKD